MKKLLLIPLLLLLAIAQAFSQDYESQKQITAEVVKYFESGSTDKIYDLFDETMRSSINAEKLTQIWNSLPAQCGGYLGSGDAEASVVQGMVVVNHFLDFEKVDLELRLAFNDKNEISGLFFVPASKKKE